MNQSLKCRTVVLKIASRCNINCSYCYVYNKGDLSYLKQPKIMSSEVVNALIVKAKNHCEAHNLDYFEFIFHGGEPLLTGIEFFKE